MESSPPFTDPSLREVPIGGYFLHSWPVYPADSTSLGRYRPSVRMASGNAILAPSLFSLVITFYESYYTGSHYGAQPAPTPLEAAHVASLFLCKMVWATLINHAVILFLSYGITRTELHPIKILVKADSAIESVFP